MSDNIRTALYDADYTLRAGLARLRRAGRCCARVVGKHCESGDIVVRDCWLPDDVAPGDLLAVAATGAYCYVDGEQLQPAAAPARWSRCATAQARVIAAPGDRSTTCSRLEVDP